jgi:hypothetical protein
MTEVHFFSVLESPAYISANRVGNFFCIEKQHFFHKISGKFPTHFPDRYVERRSCRGSKLLHFLCAQKGVQMMVFFVTQKVFGFWSFF